MLDAAGMAQAEAPDWEADDAIGSLCAQGGPATRFDIITGDRDLLQLVHDGDDGFPAVRLLFTVRGVSNLEAFDAAQSKPNTACHPTAMSTSPPCAATRPTGCPACPASARRPRLASSTSTRRWTNWSIRPMT